MRLLIILMLISFNSYADVWVAIAMLDGQSPCNGKCYFRDQLRADDWISMNVANSGWGKIGEYEIKICGKILAEYNPLTDCKVFTTEIKTEREKKVTRASDLESIRSKLKDGSINLADVINYIRIKEGI